MRRPEKIHRKGGTRWQVRFEDAHRKIRYRAFPTKAAAETFLREVDSAQRAGLDPARRVRFDELATEWRASHLASGLRPSSVKDYEAALKRLSDYFGRREVRGITAGDLEQCRNGVVEAVKRERTEKLERVLKRRPELRKRESELREQIARGGARTAAKVVGTARTLWKFAVSRGYAARNIASDVKKPKAPPVVATGVIDQNILTPTEIVRLLAHVPAEHRTTVAFLFNTGVRFGELLGVRWEDMDWASGRVLIRRQRSGLTGELTVPKTAAGTRWIDLSADLIAELKAHRLRTPGNFLFALDERNWRSRVWHPALRRAGLRSIRIHDARHTHASLLLAAGADVVAVSRRLGHSNPSITLAVYAHAVQQRTAPALGEKLAAFMRAESVGCELVAREDVALHRRTQVFEGMVARVGIEPTTRGFSIRCSTN